MEKDYITIQQKYSELVIQSQGMADSKTVESLRNQIKEIENSYKNQLKSADLREKDLAAKYKKVKNEMQDMNIEVQKVKQQKNSELEADRLARARQLAMLDMDIKNKQMTLNRNSMAFQNSSRLSRIGPALGSLQHSADQPSSGLEKESRFTMIDKMLTAD